jgi:putative membrane protein insertion efficiency factor
MKIIVLTLLKFYRWAISPVVGPCCRFEPSCSAYAEEAVHTHGAWRGLGLTAWRLLRCQPFSRGGLDPVPRRG